MEEKDRYIIDRFDEDIFDTKKEYYPSNQTICEIINQQDNRIKELEKENKELEIKLDKCGTELVNAESLVSYLENENKQLKQQLDKKEREIKKLKSENHALMSDNAYQEADIFELNSFKEYYKNNKISFAVEQLELLKSQINEWGKLYKFKFSEFSNGVKDTLFDVKEYIDNQINELKELK